jgi:hypothetical protein
MPVRQRKEIQEMLRRLKPSGRWSVVGGQLVALAVLLAVPGWATILPDKFMGALKSDAKAVQAPDPALFDEYGFDGAEQARFGPAVMTAWRFRDTTGAMAAFQYLRPADAKPIESKLNKGAARTSNGALFQYGNYVIQVVGPVPTEEEIAPVYLALPKVEQSALPVISTYLPPEGLIPNSERYIEGPVALQKFDPQIPPSVAAFHLAAEAQYGRYHTKGGDLSLLIFNYPTPSMARERAEEFRKLPGTVAKRTGPLVAVVSGGANPDAAERLLAKVNYQAALTMNETAPNREVQSFARTVVNYIFFSGLIILFCTISGLAFAGIRMLARRLRPADEEAMITLHLEGK